MSVNRFILLGIQRSGTSVTYGHLAHHPEIAAIRQEVWVRPMFSLGPRTFTNGEGPYEERIRGHQAIFDGFASSYRAGAKVLGCKLALSTVEESAELVLTLREFYPGLKLIRVRRRDAVARFASLLRARGTGQWQALAQDQDKGDSDEPKVRKMLAIPRDDLRAYDQECQRIEALLDMLEDSHEVMSIEYEEEVLSGFDPERMFAFLGVDPSLGQGSGIVKLAAKPEDSILDYEELGKFVADLDPPDPQDLRDLLQKIDAERSRQEMEEYLLSRAEHALSEGQPEKAHSDVMMLLGREHFLRPGVRHRAYWVLERAWLAMEAVKVSEEALDILEKKFANEAEFTMLQAMVAYYLKQEERAREYLRRTLELNPELPRALNMREVFGLEMDDESSIQEQ